MSMQLGGRIPQADEEDAVDVLLDARLPRSGGAPAARKALLCLAAGLGVVATAWWISSAGVVRPQPAVVSAPIFETKASLGKALIGSISTAMDPMETVARDKSRKQLTIERDLAVFFHDHISKSGAHYEEMLDHLGPRACSKSSERLFNDVVTKSSMTDEVHGKELEAFRQRFVSDMHDSCKHVADAKAWLQAAGRALERQKPVMTEALAQSVNAAGLGFMVRMQPWLVHDSAVSFQAQLGLLPTPKDQESVFHRRPGAREAGPTLPESFEAQAKWPDCRAAILRIHNQGHCGSCWAFASLASVDARMCIASGGGFDNATDVLSRLQAVSCAPEYFQSGRYDGCQGGWPHWPLIMMKRRGIVSESCLPYYIQGEGTQHFTHRGKAPPCPAHCQGGYPMTVQEDAFSARGIEAYDWLTHVHGNSTGIGMMKRAMWEEGPVPFAFLANYVFRGYAGGIFSNCTPADRANHAVFASGWGTKDGQDYFNASNSWGEHWGLQGRFLIHVNCVTDVTIPGTIQGNIDPHTVSPVEPNVTNDANNSNWPWPKIDECPYEDGCVTNLEKGLKDYAPNELCVSTKLNGKRIRVDFFDTEYSYDILTVSVASNVSHPFRRFSGKAGHGLDLEGLNHLLVGDQGIKFETDASIQRLGFKLCAE